MPTFEKGAVRIHYEEAGSGLPLLIIPGGGLNSTIAFFETLSPFNAVEAFKDEYRVITLDLRNAPAGQSSGPLDIDRPWDSHTDDQLGLMDHLGIDKFQVMGFCIGGPFIWNLLKRAPNRIVAAVIAQPSGFRPELPDQFYENNIKAELPFIPDPVAWTEVPPQVRVLARQRERWHRGLIGTMITHRDLLFNRKYGAMGMVAIPYFFFGEMLAPLIELFGYVITALALVLGAVDLRFALLLLACAIGYGSLLTVWAIVLEDLSFRRYRRRADLALLLLFAFIEGLGFRQLTVWFRLQAFWKYFRGSDSWGVMTRQGFGAPK